jgi:alpha-beta hydrolase superfamily lysophospholipase
VGVPVWLRMLGHSLAKVWPTFAMNARLDLGNLTRDEEAARAIVEDPLFHQRGTARLMAAFTRVKTDILARAGELRLPLLLLHGSEDQIASPDGSRRFFEGAASADKERKVYAGARHNLFHETNRLEVFDDLERWVEPRLAGA